MIRTCLLAAKDGECASEHRQDFKNPIVVAIKNDLKIENLSKHKAGYNRIKSLDLLNFRQPEIFANRRHERNTKLPSKYPEVNVATGDNFRTKTLRSLRSLRVCRKVLYFLLS